MRLLNFQYVCSSVEETKDLLCCSGGLTRSVACEVLETFLNSFPYAGAVATWLLLDIHHCLDKMGEAEIMSLGFDNIKIRSLLAQKKNQETISSNFQQLNGECESKDRMTTDMLEKGLMEYGCPHYRRRCHIRAPCCNEVFTCRHCHNEAIVSRNFVSSYNDINVDQKLRHDMPRHEVRQCAMLVSILIRPPWSAFSGDMLTLWHGAGGVKDKIVKGLHSICHGMILWFDSIICLPGYSFVTCYYIVRLNKFVGTVVYAWGNTIVKPASCLMMIYQRDNIIVMAVGYAESEDVEISSTATSVYLFESRQDVTVLPCGHTIHQGCLKEMQEHYQFGYSVTIVAEPPKCSSISWLRNARIANPTTLAKQEAEARWHEVMVEL
ncbi:unnamed protein product [Linum tenue]|uniref:CHY-type domain-containing protein n=1 Tax=Linum tenue TaxID=586396 RepID=A0AAV0MFQ4_9ROSI|nr:unnamed protein product [Linum tenue]